jgi:hypothetical protein
MIYRRDFLQHVGWGDQPISVGAFGIHIRETFAAFTFLPVLVFATQELRISAHK